MKISKKDLKKIILLEVKNVTQEIVEDLEKVYRDDPSQKDKEMKRMFEKLIDQLDKLDGSIDYLASVFTGEDPASISGRQAFLGKFATAPKSAKQKQE